MKETSENVVYNPNLGFIGNARVDVSNYLFSGQNKKRKLAYRHTKPVADRILKQSVGQHYQESKRLTQFLKKRDLTFSKKTAKGYKTFTVPCTTTVVPLPKSLFNQMEEASQKLMIGLRKVLQDIYGSKSLQDSEFVRHLPLDVQKIFVEAIESSVDYYPQFHHKNMKEYPFFDIVGLDLVLVEDYIQQSESFPQIIKNKQTDKIPNLPFRILELNAGSPSGASNNMNVLEGMHKNNPEILNSFGKLMPNDHFKVLGETYKSLGESWTERKDGIQIILPPGGQNGAAPEIHQLATYSGLVYADPDQLYQDDEGYIRLRTVGDHNPIVTAIYSRVNSDSALFDPDKGIILRDPESGEPYYLRDYLITDKKGEFPIIKDRDGNPIPLKSDYAIPGAIDAIINRKLYLGGLNRILDNKIILATLTHYAPKFFASDIKAAGLKTEGVKISPPQTLPPNKHSVEIIKQNPDEWVVKSPCLAGGQGVYILKTLPAAQKAEVLRMIDKRPTEFAYQQLVKIGRIPVAVSRKNDGYRFANLAADLRIWVFYGATGTLPRMTHNALVRYAPQEKGRMSSIVNTSAGGGYAPFVIVDDTNNPNAVTGKELVKPLKAIELPCELPLFAGAQVVQIARMLRKLDELLKDDKCSVYQLYGQAIGIKIQLKEIISFLHPEAMEKIGDVCDLLEGKLCKTEITDFMIQIKKNQMKLVKRVADIEAKLPDGFMDLMDNFRILDIHVVNSYYSDEEKALDLVLLEDLKELITKSKIKDRKTINGMKAIVSIIHDSILQDFPHVFLHTRSKKIVTQLLEEFCRISASRLSQGDKTREFAKIFSLSNDISDLKFETLYLGKKDSDKEIKIASQLEMRTNARLIDSDLIDENIKKIRENWLNIINKSRDLTGKAKTEFLEKKRVEHFKKYPILKRYQQLVNKKSPSKEDLIELLPVLPYAKFNIENFAKEQGLQLHDVFSNTLSKDRICLLSSEKLAKEKLGGREFAGECFAKKHKVHGLFSKSDIFIWLRGELDAFTLLYTAGHEIIHYHQIKNSMNAERRSLKDGGLSFAKFINYYGNFLGANQRTVDKLDSDIENSRKPLYGYTDRSYERTPIILDLKKALRAGDHKWNSKLEEYGSLFGYLMPNSPGVRVKALQEVLPALENAKNIIFAQELGLEISYNPVKSALPTANKKQIKMLEKLVIDAATTPEANWEALRQIASHQYFGVSFQRTDRENENLTLRPLIGTITVGHSYNQTQQ